jgi:hypothetical protein
MPNTENEFELPCAYQYPPSLIKAASDPFTYLLKLRTGEVIRFTECEIHGKYATLIFDENDPMDELGHSFPRGLDVRVDQIVWCADAPDGS